jgi:HD-GYP domain-containing protein (c-di-GMP phosphodiesterase class II)
VPERRGSSDIVAGNIGNMSTILNKLRNQKESQVSQEAGTKAGEYQARLEFLYDIACQTSSIAEISALLNEIPCSIQKILRASASSLFMIDGDKNILCLQAAGSDKSEMLRHIPLDPGSGIVGWVARNGLPVIVNDVSQDKHFNKEVDEAIGFVTRSIIATPLIMRKKVIGVLEMINKDNGGDFTDDDLGLLTEFASTEALILLVAMAATLINNFRTCQAIQDEYRSTVETLVTAADAKDPYAHGHSRRVREYVLMATASIGFTAEELKLIEFGALLHDIGKIGIDDRILRKATQFTEEEWYIVRKHSLKGANIVNAIPNLRKATDIILYHHERYDGTGYPKGLKGEQIPIGARLIAVADAFDTMTTERAYRRAQSFDEAINELRKCSGAQFCPVAVEAFIAGFQKQKGTLVDNTAGLTVQEMENQKTESTEKTDEAPPLTGKQAGQTVEEAAKQEAGEAIKAKEAIKLTEKEARQAAKEAGNQEAEEAIKAKEAIKLTEKEARQAVKEEAKREAEEARKAREALKLAEKEARQAAKKKNKGDIGDIVQAREAGKDAHDISNEFFQGDVQLSITPLVSFRQINQFRKYLKTVANLRITSETWTESDGFIIGISAQESLALGSILQEMPGVEKVYGDGKKIVAVLKVPEEHNEQLNMEAAQPASLQQ